VAEESGFVLATVQIFGVGVGQAVLSRSLAQAGQIRLAGHRKQGLFRPRRLRLRLANLLGLGQRNFPGQQGGFGIGTIAKPVGGLQLPAGLASGSARLSGQPGASVFEAVIPEGAGLHGAGRGEKPHGGASFLRSGQLSGNQRAVAARK
jgi:hypothetical protein